MNTVHQSFNENARHIGAITIEQDDRTGDYFYTVTTISKVRKDSRVSQSAIVNGGMIAARHIAEERLGYLMARD